MRFIKVRKQDGTDRQTDGRTVALRLPLDAANETKRYQNKSSNETQKHKIF